ncbi:MAG: hypothetical protein AB1756_08215 [Acidobacteriota bacterium]
MNSRYLAAIAMMITALTPSLMAEVSLEEVVQAGGLAFYRDHADPHKYYYIPGEPRLVIRKDGTPEFTFIKYMKTGGDIKGGIIHFLVTWGLSDNEIMSAESALQMIDAKAKVAGPVPFKEGTFKIVSATSGQGGLFNVKVCGEGKAPIMPNQKAAVSIALTQEGATLLWESFKNPTSDISVMFMMKHSGITPAYQAKLKVDWDKVYTHHEVAFQAKGTIKMFQLEGNIKAILDELRQKGAIQVDVVGENQNMQKLLDVAYNHLIKLMCDAQLVHAEEVQPSGTSALYHQPGTILDEIIHKIRIAFLPLLFDPLLDPMLPCLESLTGPGMSFKQEQREQPAQTEDCDKDRLESSRLAFTRANNFLNARRYEEAIEELKRAYETCPVPEYLFTIGSIYYEALYRYTRAREYYERFMERGGTRESYQGLIDMAQERISRIREAEPLLQTGGQHFAERNYREAIRDFERADELIHHVFIIKNIAACYYEMAWETRSQEDFRTALQYYRRFLTEDPNFPHYRERELFREEARVKMPEIESILSSGRLPDGTDLLTAASGSLAPIGEQRPGRPESVKPPSSVSPAAPGTTPSGTVPPETPSKPMTKPPAGASGTRPSTGLPGASIQAEAPFQFKFAYTFKRVKLSGHYEVDLRQRLREECELVISGNIHGVYQKYGEDKRFFTTISLDDPVFQERTINVILDGQDFSDFKNYINSVSVIFKKHRWGKEPTMGEVKFFDEQFAQKGNILSFIYGREGEASTEWLNYEFKPKWSFYGGIEWEGTWMKSSDSAITLSPPIRYRTLQISVDQDNLLKNRVRAVAFQIKHQIFGKEVLKEVIIDYAKGDPLETQYRYLHEEGKPGYGYKAIWLLMDGREIHTAWLNKESPFIYGYFTQ